MKKRWLVKGFFLLLMFLPFFPSTKAKAYEEPVAGIAISLENLYQEQESKIYNVGLSSELQKYTYDLCQVYDVDFELAIAIMDGESEYQVKALGINDNGTTDSGLMQINSCNHEWLKKELGITDFFDPKQNIHCGVFMIADLMDRHTDLHEILMCYNMGEDTVRELHGKGIYSSKYSRAVMEKFNKLKEEMMRE